MQNAYKMLEKLTSFHKLQNACKIYGKLESPVNFNAGKTFTKDEVLIEIFCRILVSCGKNLTKKNIFF